MKMFTHTLSSCWSGRRAVVLATAVFGLAGLLTACGEDEDYSTPTVVPKAPKEKAPDPVDAEKNAADMGYAYNAVGRRDPFETYFSKLKSEDEPQPGAKFTELQKIEIDKLKLVAVVVGTATPMAMVEEPGGRGHTVKIGTLVGKRLGQVKHIRRGEVIIQEEFRDFTGKRIPQLKTLRLEEPEQAP